MASVSKIAPITGRGMALMKLCATNDGPLALTARDVRTAGQLARLVPALVLIRTTVLPDRKTKRRYCELTQAGREAVRRALCHA